MTPFNYESFLETSQPHSLNADLDSVIQEFHDIKDKYDIDEMENPFEQDIISLRMEGELSVVLARRALFPLGERIDMSGDIACVDERQVMGMSAGYTFAKFLTRNHIDARVAGFKVLPLPTLELHQEIKQQHIYMRDSFYADYGLALLLDQMAIISPSAATDSPDEVRFGVRTKGIFPVEYPGLVLTHAIPREAVLAEYGN